MSELNEGKFSRMSDSRISPLDQLPEKLALKCVLRASDAAHFCGVSLSHFRRLHSRGKLPRPIKLGERRLGWRLGDLVAWLESRQLDVY
jgi:predicted DNA-binding transcriptional regulator AlpA